MSEIKTCTKTCPKHGEYEARTCWIERRSLVPLESWTGCPACIEEENRECEAEEKRARIAELLEVADIPARFASKSFGDFHAATKQQKAILRVAESYAAEFEANLKACRCLVFLGGVGTGKTHLGCAIAQAVVGLDHEARYTTALDFIRAVRQTWHRGAAHDEAHILKGYCRPDLLIVDEIGVSFGSDSELTQLTDLLDMRYRELRPSIVISNCDVEGLKRFLGERVIDRLRENGGQVCVFDWGSFRSRAPAVLTVPGRSGTVEAAKGEKVQ
ncbi:MAG: ATP-binding protein [Candidatus Korobacteraceae bacterium]